MARFPIIENEAIVQVGDKTRIDATKSFATPDQQAISNVEIEPESGSGFIAVFDADSKKWFLDWVYSGVSRTVAVSVRVTTGHGGNALSTTNTKALSVLTHSDDYLFSSDSDLIAKESDILKRVRPGRSSFLDVHRQAQTQILQWLDESGYRSSNGSKIIKTDLVDKSEVSAWSRDLVLHLLFQNFSNQRDDIFFQKSQYYKSEFENRRDRAVLAYDWNRDGQISLGEKISMNTRDLIQQ